MSSVSSNINSLGTLPKSIAARKPLLCGNRAFIDFTNSSYCPTGTTDPLSDWRGFLHFLVMTQAITRDRARELVGYEYSQVHDVLAIAKTVREQLTTISEHIAEYAAVPDGATSFVNDILEFEDGGFRLSKTGQDFTLGFAAATPSPHQGLTALAHSFAGFVCNDKLSRFRSCANPNCPLYFYDISKNGRRRWCRMEVCGNRAKAADHYHRSRQPT